MSEEERREQLQKVREENQRTAARVERGTAYHETVKVYFTDRQEHAVEVYALSGRQFRAAYAKAGVNPTRGDLKNPERLLDSLAVIAAIAEAATSPEIVDQLLGPDQEAKVSIKATDLLKIPKNLSPSSEAPSTPSP